MSRPETKASSYGAEHDGPVHEGGLTANGRRFALVAARFNDSIVEKLIDGAREALRRTGAAADDVELYPLPGRDGDPGAGAPGGRHRALRRHHLPGRGHPRRARRTSTSSCARRRAASARWRRKGKIAVAFGVLACDTIEQAVERAGAKEGNRGSDAAMVAVEMADLYARMRAEEAAAQPPTRRAGAGHRSAAAQVASSEVANGK